MTHSYEPRFENLPPRIQDRLSEAFSDKQDSFGAYVSLALASMNRGWSETDYENVLADSSLFMDYPYSDRHHERDISKAWLAAEELHDGRSEYTPENYKGTITGQEEVREILTDLASSPLVEGLRRNTRSTVLAVIQEGVKRGAWTLDLSVRTISELSGFSRQAVSNHLTQASEAGVLRMKDQGVGKARTIILETDREKMGYSYTGENVDTKYSSNGCKLLCVKLFPTLVFSRHGLGQTAHEIYTALLDLGEPASISATARAAGCDRKTARTYLHRMIEHGLIVQRLDFTTPRYEAAVDPDLDAIANLLQVDESREAMEDLHDTERELYARARTNWQPPEPEVPEDPQPELLLLPIPDPPPADDEVLPEDDYVEPVPVWDPPSQPDLSTGQDPFDDINRGDGPPPSGNPFDAIPNSLSG